MQQSYAISIETAIEKTKGINLSVTAFPNPTTDFLTLEIKEFELSDLYVQLYDMNGKLVQSQKIIDSQTTIAMGELVPATYFVKVVQNNKEVKTFKIIKK